MVKICTKKTCENPSCGKRGLCQEHYDKVITNERNYDKRNEEIRSDPNRGREYRKKYDKSEKGRVSSKKRYGKYMAKPESKIKKTISDKKRRSTPEYKEGQHNLMQAIKKKVFSVYSKRYSDSNIPICRCCHETIMEFLELDHIEGREEMAQDLDAKKWQYSPKWKGQQLWTKVDECYEGFGVYPEGFQVLCSNCNQSKKNSGTHKTCFHKLVQDPKFKIPVTYRSRLRRKVFSHYSKKHDNNTPICRCCGESFFELLTIDHVLGKKVMDKIPELTDLGYSSKMEISELLRWIKDHNFFPDFETEYFQVLCYNCNQAKGRSSKDNTCPHEKIRKEEML